MKIGVIFNTFAGKDMMPEEDELKNMGLSVGKALEELGHDVIFFDMDVPEDIENLSNKNIDVAFNLCERVNNDPMGEAYVPSLLELWGIPHTSLNSSLVILAINKPKIKSILSYHKIPTPPFQVFSDSNEALDPRLRFPLIVKGVRSENSIGLDDNSVVENQKELRQRVGYIIEELKQEALVEEFIDGREFNVAILGGEKPLVMPISEILFDNLPLKKRICNYEAKWATDSEMYCKTVPKCPAELSKNEEAIVKGVALKAYNVLGCDSYVRVDIRFRDNIPYILEINQNPSIGEEGCGFVRSAKAFGLSYKEMVDAILQKTIRKYNLKK